MSITAAALVSDLLKCVDKGNTYGKPQTINLAKLQQGGCKVMCAGFVKAALPSLYNGTNTIWREGYLTDKGSISDHKSSNGYTKTDNPKKFSQLKIGMAVFKWQQTGCSKAAHQKDGKGNYCHIGIVTSINPFKVVHCSSEQGKPVVTGKGKFCAWGYLKGVDYGSDDNTGSVDHETKVNKQDGDNMADNVAVLYKAKVINGSLNVRAAKDKKSTKKGQFSNGTIVDVFLDFGEWVYCSDGKYSGYCMSEYLDKIEEHAQEPDTEPAAEPEKETEPETEQEPAYDNDALILRIEALEKRMVEYEEAAAKETEARMILQAVCDDLLKKFNLTQGD